MLSENDIHSDQVMVVTPIDSRTHLVLYQNTTADGLASGLIEQEPERLWYAIIQQPTTGIQLEIQGLDNGGQVIYSSQENED
ncbi:hypothetical protein [Paenibacillus sp. ACRRY]|uniref:hypothetical protein n=1 Tax=Paenibacillus sp. ACRRY TaxID=2918208 RepID=UPI001EF6F609|nr:hypothetical protein [Paenibacillus sp. ACRRY]MCG7384402.1 hypothetical protein [Paenibacillus sp. ACRRY]